MNTMLEPLSNPLSSLGSGSKPLKKLTLAEALLKENIAPFRGELADVLVPPQRRERLRHCDFNPENCCTSLREYCNKATEIMGERIYFPGEESEKKKTKKKSVKRKKDGTESDEESDKKKTSKKKSVKKK
ncbi:predicted protein [Naegleria gruberi]|uniref:Predicted protein n=1 Tax=Naegleria gruberi TaxID=5762 RepID=D2VVB5_NAEGR|nr:uncharacterized protein NAEGRDRAFT_72957 [Naegleria gruberi]EFC39207.1 predicted protein [Naegleria gruberi]|eukprot:XP_002671951.1 predicted protein [Naegleria gruberi strain NEG-M]